MKKALTFVIALFAVAAIVSSAMAAKLTTEEAMQQVAQDLEVQLVPQAAPKALVSLVSDFVTREEITTLEGDTIAHYTIRLKVGPFKYDTIGIHRVVKEVAPGIPAPTTEGILCSGGDISPFNMIYMPSTLMDPTGQTPYTLGQIIGAPDHSFGIFLAKNSMDVWGIDWRWATVVADPNDPATYPVPEIDPATGQVLDPGLMHMNTDTHMSDFELVLKIARLTRALTGQGHSKMYLTGHSRGAYITLALANKQAEYRSFARDLKGIIPVDFPFKSDDPAIVENACYRVAGYDHVMDLFANNGGVYPPFAGRPDLVPPVFNTTGLAFMGACLDSLLAPTGTNELFGVSNENVFDIFAGATWFPFALSAGGTGDWQWSHFTSAPIVTLDKYDENNPYYGFLPFPVVFPNPMFPGVPDTEMVYSNAMYIKLAGLYAAPFQSYGEQRDSMVCLCGAEDSPYDDNLSDVHVPVLMVACDGGAIAGSADAILNQLGGDDKMVLDLPYGHSDPYFANDAEVQFWQPMLDWILLDR